MPKMRFELWRSFKSHSHSKNLDSESDNSDSDSKNLYYRFWSSSTYKTTKTLIELVWSWFRITPKFQFRVPKTPFRISWTSLSVLRTFSGVYLEFLDSKTSGLEFNLVVKFAILIFIA